MTRLVTALALAALAGPAWARCPTGADLATGGIIVEEPNGFYTLFRASGEHLVHGEQGDDLGPNTVILLARGVHLFFSAPVYGEFPALDEAINYAIPMTAEQMPAPEPGLNWEVTYMVAAHSGYGADTWSETMTQNWADMTETLTIGDCTYEVLRGTAHYDWDDGEGTEDLIYFTDLGITHVAGWTDPELETSESYEIADIRPTEE